MPIAWKTRIRETECIGQPAQTIKRIIVVKNGNMSLTGKSARSIISKISILLIFKITIKGTGTDMYTSINFKSKKALKDAVFAGQKVTVYSPGLGNPPDNGTCSVEGPHYPEPHKWYAEVTLVNGMITKVK